MHIFNGPICLPYPAFWRSVALFFLPRIVLRIFRFTPVVRTPPWGRALSRNLVVYICTIFLSGFSFFLLCGSVVVLSAVLRLHPAPFLHFCHFSPPSPSFPSFPVPSFFFFLLEIANLVLLYFRFCHPFPLSHICLGYLYSPSHL